MGKRHTLKENKTSEVLNIEEITKLGGDKKDAKLIEDVGGDDEEVLDIGEDFEAEPIKRDEIRDFIKQLGFDDVMEVVEESPEDDSAKKQKQKKEKQQQQQQEQQQQQPANASGKNDGSESTKKKKKRNKYKVQDEEISSTTAELDLTFIQAYQPRKHLLPKLGGKWLEQQMSDEAAFDTTSTTDDKISRLKDYAKKVHQDDVALYKKKLENSKKSDSKWIQTVLKSGTVSDKMAALTLLIQEAPVHNLASLEHFITIVKKRGRREALLAFGSLKELFLTELLPDDRKLKSFDQHPINKLGEIASGNKDTRDKRLVMWYFEEQLQQKYAEFVQALEVLCHDNILAAKLKALVAVFELLAGKPEQEKKLLSILTNKLGDPDYKVASKAAHLLTKLVERHPNMKNVVVAEVERLMYRPNVAEKAQYYAVCFLNQIIFNKDESVLALRLINIYFSFFKAFVKKGEVDSKMMSALLSGVNRAYPYAKVEADKISEQLDTLYRIVHIVSFNTSIQALMLLYQVMGSNERTSDRYYQALYGKLNDPGLIASSKQAMFLNLLFKSMKKDPVDRRIKAFIKRLLQVCGSLPVPFVCGSMVLLSQILKEKPTLFQLSHSSQDSDDEDEHFVDVKTEDDENEDSRGKDAEDGPSSPETRQEEEVKKVLGHEGHTTVGSWVHKKNREGGTDGGAYDPRHRNPLYTRAEVECIWELEKLASHFHPSVALFANHILKGTGVKYAGDPLEDFTLIRFLDRFVFRNPKKREDVKGTKDSVIHGRLQARSKKTAGAKSLAINSEEYLQMEESDIPVDEKFFYKYFTKRAEKKSEEDEVDSDVDDDEFDDYLDKYEKGFDGADFKLDFAGEFSKKSTKSKKRSEMSDSDDDDDDDDLDMDDDLSDEEVDFSDDEEMRAAFDGDEDAEFNEEDLAFSDDEFGASGGSKRKAAKDDVFLDGFGPTKKKGKKPKELDSANLFAAAEEFSHLMDESSSTKLMDIGTEALSNKDNADVKQLNWEINRDRWVRGQDWKSKKRQRGPQLGFKGKAKPRGSKSKPHKQGRGKKAGKR